MNLAKAGCTARSVLDRRQRERCFLRLFEQAWALQCLLGGHVHAENPVGSAAWKELELGPVYEVDFHMCSLGLACPTSGLPIKKPTRVVTSDPELAGCLATCQCPGHPKHQHIEGGKLSKFCETYPKALCKRIARCLSSQDETVHVSHDVFMGTDDEADSERETDSEPVEQDRQQAPADRNRYTAMKQKLHVNTAHASVPQMLRLAQRVRAPPAVIAKIREFRCPICEELQVPPSHKVAALRHTESPNHIVGLDVVQVELKKETSQGVVETKYNVLTVVDYATDFAQQIVLPDRMGTVSQAFHSVWCRPFGLPRVVYVDPDQRWMSDDFQKYLRQNSICLLDSASESH